MCIMAMAWRVHPRWRLILAGNRDETHARPAAPLGRWDSHPSIIAGRDLQSGGTWLGVSDEGRCAIVTNRRGFGVAEPDRPSRGQLVAELLAGEGDFSDPATAAIDELNPFNLVFIAQGEAHFLTNRPRATRSVLTPGLYGLSNGALDEPWPKTLQLKAALLDFLTHGGDTPDALFEALGSETFPNAGIPPEYPSDIADEAAVSPVFIRNPVYGTRCSTVIAVDMDGRGTITERRFDADGNATGASGVSFRWNG
ncbi:NRDE family protein [Sphingobium phenoxybenzoativorans]|uniref:NRDE family protein n=1 Tax=Sphingobium phenoxybenzoativorans TaxID=1592790 RepID=A0A975K830_9SPHN|nr:NRDE family protein [Sphingobium phenoxybenzoativorans]QUT05808.1 NRDE family protein [Sphingobium phenoxybenzoativorans]